MLTRTGLLLGFTVLAAQSAVAATPVRIMTGDKASDLERYAAAEVQSYLGRITEPPVALGAGDGLRLLVGTAASLPAVASFTPSVGTPLTEQEILVRAGTLDGAPALLVTGGSPPAVLWAAYALLEKLGVVFEFSGEALPVRKPQLDIAGLDLRQSPTLAERGLRLHLNFPMDQSAYALPDFLTWVDRMARMKFNYLMFHFYSAHPWFRFQYRDATTRNGTFFVGSYMFNGRYDLPADMIGRDRIHNRSQFFPPELEGQDPGEELYRKTEERLRAVMDRCHARGIRVAVSFEPLAPPGDIASHLGAWEKDAGGREALMRDMTAARLLACMDAYPQADEFQLISVEGSNDAPPGMDLKTELSRLCRKFGVPFDPSDETRFAGAKEDGVHLAPYNDPGVAADLQKGLYQPVVSTLRYVELALDVLADLRVAARLKRDGKLGNVGIYLPHGNAVRLCVPALRAMMPPGSRLQLMVDYGARGTADQMPQWDAFRRANLQLGVISWLEFDGSMFLPQAWPHAVYDCVRNAQSLPVTTLVGNHWRVSGLEADAAGLAEVPWAGSASYDEWFNGYLARVFGMPAAPLGRKAYDALEAATLYCRAHLFNVGFCWEGRYRQGFGYPKQHMDEARRLFTTARTAFADVAVALPDGHARARAGYLANRCECAVIHLDTMDALAATDVKPDAPPETLRAAGAAAEKAIGLARQYMSTYAKEVRDRGDEGMLVNYQFSLIHRATELAQGAGKLAAIAGADPQRPVMHWSFDTGDAAGIPDQSGNGFAATCVGVVGFADGHSGRALALDGKTYLRIDGSQAFNPASFSLSAWIKPETVSARRGLVVKRVGNGETPFVLGIANGKLQFEGCGAASNAWSLNFSGPAVAAGTWTHVAVTFEAGKQITLYLNGKEAAVHAITESPKPNTDPLVIGREAWGAEEGADKPAFFRGLIDDVKVWKRALSGAEIAAEVP